MSVTITSFYAAISAFLIVYLAYRVANLRRLYQRGVGERDHRDLKVAVRVHGNTVENVLITLFLMLMCELNGGNTIALVVVGAVMILSRLSHAWGMTVSGGRYSLFRISGILANWCVILGLAVWSLVLIL